SAILIAIFTEPLYGVSISMSFGFIGLIFGYMAKNNRNPNHIILLGALSFLGGVAITAIISFLVMGVNPINLFFKMYEESFPVVINIYKKMGISKEQIDLIQKTWDQLMTFIKQALPSMLFMGGIIISYINYWIAHSILNRLKISIPAPISLTLLKIPPITVSGFLIAFLLVFLGGKNPTGFLYHLGINLEVIFSVLFLLDGLLVVNFWMSKGNLSMAIKVIIFIFIIFQPIFSQIVTWLGLFDVLFNMRRTSQDTQ
ncbi:MAG: DUF2232 domain-containing protein, partial [bacterium]